MKEAYKHDYSGSCDPNSDKIHGAFRTFSVGCFQWLPKASGKGLKKSAVIYRISGPTGKADQVYTRAEEVCSLLDTGWESDKKSERIK